MNVRQYALEVIEQVMFHHGFASLIMRSNKHEFSQQDRGLISELVYGTIRNYRFLERQWYPLVSKKVRPKTEVLITMSVYQLLYLDRIPDYAIIHEAVELADQRDKKFVNAILRGVVTNGIQDLQLDDELEKTAIQTSHPLWIMQLWKAHYGLEHALKIAKHNQQESVVYGRINTLKVNKLDLMTDKNITFKNDEVFVYNGIISKTQLFQQGLVVIQDIASAEIARFVSAEPGMRVLDVCAAPGTKTQQIAMHMKNQGEIIALDLYEHRLELLQQLMHKTGVDICKSFVHDATKESEELEVESFDRILVDAPCSGLGDLAHKPEIRYHLTAENIDQLVVIQKQILDMNAKYLKKNGILVYSTCTLNKKENERQIANFLKTHIDFELLEEKTFFPFENNSDGFYVAQLRKIDGRV